MFTVVALLSLSCRDIRAAEIYWKAPVSGSLLDSSNWNPVDLPNRPDTIVFDLGSTGYTGFLPPATGNLDVSLLRIGNDSVSFDLGGQKLTVWGRTGSPDVSMGIASGDQASLSILNGTVIGDGTIGDAAGSTATLKVDGSQGPAHYGSGTTYIGAAGVGALNVSDGGTVDLDQTYVGYQSASEGFISIQGTGSQLDFLRMYLGSSGSGSLEISNGGSLKGSGVLYLGDQPNSTGSIEASGAGSLIATGSSIYVGNKGTGNLSLLDGAELTYSGAMLVGYEAGAEGTVVVDRSELKGAAVNVGSSGHGTLIVQNGSRVHAPDDSYIAGENGSASVTLDGAGTTWLSDNRTGDLYLGNYSSAPSLGHATLIVKNGAHFLGGNIGAGLGGTDSEIVFDGAGTRVDVVNLGVLAGTMVVQNGATVTAESFNFSGRKSSPVNVTIDGPTTQVEVFNLRVGGRNSLTSQGALTLSKGAQVTVNGQLLVDIGGFVDIRREATLFATEQSSSAVEVGGGIFQVDGAVIGNVRVNYDGTLTGSGVVEGNVLVEYKATISPGNSPGKLDVGSTTWLGGGTYKLEVNRALGGAGQALGWDLLNVEGTVDLIGSRSDPLIISLHSLTPTNSRGQVVDFDSSRSYAWTFLTASEGITGFSPDIFRVDTFGSFSNPLGERHFEVRHIGNSLVLAYIVPEPATLSLIAIAAIALPLSRRSRSRWPRSN